MYVFIHNNNAGAKVDLPINSKVTQPSLDLFLIVNCWQTLSRKAYINVFQINLLNVSKGCWQNADAVAENNFKTYKHCQRMLLYLYM